MAWLRDGRDEEDSLKFENALREAEGIPHPFHVRVPSEQFKPQARPASRPLTVEEKQELPIEVVKKQEAAEEGKPFRVPEWWRGEEAAYKSSKAAMGGVASLPKMG